MPSPESAGRKLFIRFVSLVALAISVCYLIWRAAFTIDPHIGWISIPFFLLEVHAAFSLALFTFSLWDVDSLRPARHVRRTSARIAVLIPTYNESREVLLPTITAALALKPGHETWVLDDGNRAEVKELAEQLGARYIARRENTHAKAGNINHALALLDADLVAILDADHVARPDFLTKTLGYFDDPRVALVQTPQDFYNLDSFEHDDGATAADGGSQRDRYHEEGLFYRVIQPAKNRWGGAFWCGTGAVVRVSALREIGGLATETVTEDIHTTVRLHRRGWRTVYHNEVLARGLAARTAAEYQLQRFRWGAGAMQLLKLENPLVAPGLTLAQRIAYAATLFGWFEAWRSLGYLLVPIAVLFTGAVPIRAHPAAFLPLFISTFVLQQVALRVLSRGYHRLMLPVVFEFVRMTPNLLATLTLLPVARPRFRVTPKGRLDERRRQRVPLLLATVLALSALAAVWFALTFAGLTPIAYEARWAAYAAAFWLELNALLVALAMLRVRSLKYGAERRASVRFDTSLPGVLDTTACRVEDVSLTGALVSLGPGAGRNNGGSTAHLLRIEVEGITYRFKTQGRSGRTLDSGRRLLGLEFLKGQDRERARLALALFNAQIVPGIVPANGRSASSLQRPRRPAKLLSPR